MSGRPRFRLLLLLLLLPAARAAAQGRDTTVVAGPEYRASDLKDALLGRDYRYLWTTPVRVPFLDLDTTAGGLKPVEVGGGRQTRSLHLLGADGREYRFRSVNKWPDTAEEPAIHGTFVADIIQDQTSSLNPAGALVVPPLLDAVGVLHVAPRLVVMPDVPELGEFREEFAGMLGQLEVAPNEGEDDTPGFGGFRQIADTDRLLEHLEEEPEHRADARAYLTARLVDLLINDWDRNPGNWRWARTDSADAHYWIPLPRDRDYALVNYDGALLVVLRRFVPNSVKFTPEIDNVYGLTLNARAQDRRLLAGLERPAWDSIAAFFQSRITDEVIDDAVSRMPREYHALVAPKTAGYLKTRRNTLREAAEEFYELLATEVDVQATDERDVALVDRRPDGSVLVRLYDADEENRPKGAPFFQRRFLPDETNEVRIDLHGGGDRAVVRGVVDRSLTVRIVGGGGDDVLVDSSAVRSGDAKTAFYDSRGENRFVEGPVTHVSTRPFDAPEEGRSISGEGYRDWGARGATTPAVGWKGEDGPIVGATLTRTRFGFRKMPYASLVGVTGRIGLFSGAVSVEAFGDFRRQNSAAGYSFDVRASQLEAIRFYGFGNASVAEFDPDFYEVRQNRIRGEAAYHLDLPGRSLLRVGPVAELTRTELPPGTPFEETFSGDRVQAQAGALVQYLLDHRDAPRLPRHGVLVELQVEGYPVVRGSGQRFASGTGVVSGYWTPAGVPLGPTLALRAGGRKVTDGFPIHEAAFLGGSQTIRGFASRRYAGDAAVWGNAELRVPVDTVRLLVRGQLGVSGLADVGRVYYDGESPGGWHRALGGGVWFAFRIRNSLLAASATYAHGEDGRIYLKLSAPF
jgi:hypothetical protein